MAKNVSLLGANYPDVPAVVLPKTGGGSATFTDTSDTTADASDVTSGKVFYSASGQRSVGTRTPEIITQIAPDLSEQTAKTLIDYVVTLGCKLYYCSSAGSTKLSDLPTTIAGFYIVFPDTYYKKLVFIGNDGIIHEYTYDIGWNTISPTT